MQLDCLIIGYNEVPFHKYESFLRKYGEDTEAYRDLKFSFVDVLGEKMDFVGLLNRAISLAGGGRHPSTNNDLKSGDIPNLAAVYLTAFLRRNGLKAEYINLFQVEKDRLIEYLDQKPVCVAITTTFYVINLPVHEIVEFIRERNPKVKIVVGGPLIANHARNSGGDALKAALDDIGADIYVVEGQGEYTLTSLVKALKTGGDLSRIPNLIYSEQGKLLRTGTVPENNSLLENYIDWSDFPDRELGRTIQMRTARSCAFNCSFCNYPARAGKLTLAGIDTVKQELDSTQKLGNVRNIVFIDDTFNVPLPRFKQICQMMIENRYPFSWFSYFRCSNSDEEAIELMAKSGCKGVFLGIESGSQSILKNMNKAATIEKYVDGMKLLHQYGILTFGSFIVGFPGETEETVKETVEFIRETKPHYYRAQTWYCEPGTPIDSRRSSYGIEGEGFVWRHNTMDSLEAMDHIDRLFLTIENSIWLPQWSFDFWIIPYLLGKGIDLDAFRNFMSYAHKMLAMEIAYVPGDEKRLRQREYLKEMTEVMKRVKYEP
jgi:p-methyltransferase